MKFLICVLLVFSYVPLTNYFKNKTKKEELSRKLLHILSYATVWLYSFFIYRNTIFFIIIPMLFTIISTVLVKFNIAKARNRKENNGTLYEMGGLAFTILSIITYFKTDFVLSYGLGAFVLIVGDAMASLIGRRYGKYSIKLFNNKTLIGTLAFIIFSIIGMQIPIMILGIPVVFWKLLLLSIIASIVEIYSKDYDNFFIPISVALFSLILI